MSYKFSIIQKLFFICSGASIEGLSKCPESEHRKYGFIGAIILLTSIFATLSGGYALYYIFHAEVYAVGFGLLWGFFILNLDRFIISSMRKSGSFWREFRQSIPRFVLALIIAISIARPLEIGMFSEEINSYLIEQKSMKKIAVLQEFNSYIEAIKNEFNGMIGKDMGVLEEYQSLMTQKCTSRDQAYKSYLCERDGTCGTSAKGYGPEAMEKRRFYQRLEDECTALIAKVDELDIAIREKRDAFERGLQGSVASNIQDSTLAFMEETQEINRLKIERDKRLKDVENSFSTSFSSMNSALWGLQKSDQSAMLISIVVSLLFVIVEIAPITVKLLSPKGPYDYVLDAERDLAEAFYLKTRDALYAEKINEYERQLQDHEKLKKLQTLKAFQEAKAPLEEEVLAKMLNKWKENPGITEEHSQKLSENMQRMLNEYSEKSFAYGTTGEILRNRATGDYAQPSGEPEAKSASSGIGARFLIIPVTFIVTVVSYLGAQRITDQVSPFVVSFISGVLYLTLIMVYLGYSDNASKDTEKK